MGEPRQACFEALNKMNYLGIARFVSQMENADVATIQRSQHVIHMVTPNKLATIMKNWIAREITNSRMMVPRNNSTSVLGAIGW